MYHAIVFLPLLGAIIAALITLAGARARYPGGPPDAGAEDHAHGPVDESHAHGAPSPHGAHAALDASHGEPEVPQPAAAGSRAAELVTTVFLFASMLLSWFAFVDVGFGHHDSHVAIFSWMTSGDLKVDWALRIDTLTVVMLVVVTTISSFVHLYSIGYMDDDPFRPRFFSYLSLFTFAMLMLVTADNLVQLFFGWEGVGLMSYLLIGFWYQKPEANAAAIKAFVVNRIGDFGFSLGIFAVFLMTGAVDFDTVFAQAPALTGKTIHFLSWDVDALTLICLLLFMGAMGKSAQFLLHTWLPDAMEGPTPVSALDPCRHHGDGRRVHGGAALAAVRAGAERADLRHLHRRHDRVLRRHHRAGAERHQAHHRLFDLLAARLHVRRHGHRRLFRRHVPPVHACLLQGAAVPRLGLGDPGDAPRAGHPAHGRPEGQDPVHLLDHGDRYARADRLSAHRRLLLQGRHHRGGLCEHQPDGALCVRDDRHRGGADRVLFLAADLPDVPRQPARPSSLRGGAREPDGDADSARLSRGRLDLRRLPVQGAVRRPRGGGVLPRLAQIRAEQPHPRGHAPRSLSGQHRPDGDDGGRLRHRLGVLHPPAGAAGRARAPAGAALQVPAQQVVLRRDLRLPDRSPDPVARPRAVEIRRRLDDRRFRAGRRLRARARRDARRGAAADRLSLSLCLRHADRRRGAHHLVHVRRRVG